MERFWDKVDKSNNCWEWTAATQNKGYGVFSYKGNNRALAHRVVMQLEGHDVKGLFVLHKCDNRLCVRPDHLYLGDAKDNMQDAIDRDRVCHGEDHPDSKLSDDEVAELRQKYEDTDVLQKELAEEYGVTQSNVSRLVNSDERRVPRYE